MSGKTGSSQHIGSAIPSPIPPDDPQRKLAIAQPETDRNTRHLESRAILTPFF
ncbi:MAG TPA: hypothetical protein VFN20_03735 [Candidatus Acidoferrum sp.]|nr:hypothetical protein [Candidatus Acidoferrum sp.]